MLLVSLVLAGAAPQDQAAPAFSLEDAQGSRHSLPARKPTALLFLGVECPMTNRYLPRLADLQKAFPDVSFLAINSNAFETRDAIARHATDNAIPFPVLLDPDQKSADAYKVTIIPTAIFIDSLGAIRYRGRIDDHKSEDLVRHRFLRDALEGKDVASTESVGCELQRRVAELKEAAITYAGAVAKILNERCVTCHRPGQVAPFSLTTYEHARRWSKNIVRATHAGTMPPWKPANLGVFRDERRLSKDELDTLAKWADAGAPLGDPEKAPAAPKFADGWMLGEPDVVLDAGEYDLGPNGPDEYRCFTLPTTLDDDKWVAAVEVRPGNFRVVHHVIAYVDTSGASAKLDEKDPKPGYRSSGTGPGFTPTGEMGGWAPGNFPRALPDGVGRLLKKGARIVLEVHYHRNGRAEKDRTSIGLHLAKKPVQQRLQWLTVLNYAFTLPAGKERHRVTARHTARNDITVHSIMPHMHLLGREIRVEAEFPDGTKRTLVNIADWDFNWQDTYHFKEPQKIPKGTKILLESFYDNSAANPNQPRNPPKAVGWGEETTDEMCIAFLAYTKDDETLPNEDD